MNEYISREDVLKKAKSSISVPTDNEWDCGYNTAMAEMQEFIKQLPVADVQPVKRGRWEEIHISLCKWIPEDEKEEGHSFYMAELKCSCCERYNAVTFVLTLNKPDFCQLCGARMDGDSE